MEKVMKKFLMCLLMIVFVNLLPGKVYAGSQNLNSLHFEIEIKENGTVHVEETWDVTATGINTLFKNFEIGSNGNEDYKIKNVEVYDYIEMKSYKDTKKEQYHVDENSFYGLMVKSEIFEIAWNIGADNSTKNKIYKISYDVENVIQNGKDFSQFYWQLVSENNNTDVQKITATMYLPQPMQKEEECKVWGHGPLNATIFQTTETKIEIEGDRLKAGEMFEIRIVMPTGIFSNNNDLKNITLKEIIEEETNWANEANDMRDTAKKDKNSFFYVLANVGILLISVYTGYRIYENYKKYIQAKKERYENYAEYYRDIPDETTTPAECLFLLNDIIVYEQTSAIVMANILNFHTRGLIELYEENNNIMLKLEYENPENTVLKKEEKTIMDIIKSAVKSDKVISMDKLFKYIKKHAHKIVHKFEDIPNMAKEELLIKNHLFSAKYSGITLSSIILLFSIIFAIPASMVVMLYFKNVGYTLLILIAMLLINSFIKGKIRKLEIYTVEGYKEKLKWKGFKKYLSEYSRICDRETMDVVLWEKYLVYATAMGISSKVINELELTYPEAWESMDEYSVMRVINSKNFERDMRKATTSLRSSYNSVHQTSSYSNDSFGDIYSSGSGGGGGFSSGGGGRSRRRKHGRKIKKSTSSKKREKTRKKKKKF